ncbi:sugar O-acetyltransferase [Demequina capsici]|uniref:Sugar O-acetyltransferase n=1 Tax=Demequina capsici TaxID=3075620 RepID=A0AA96J9M2_9MICO|nr:MULTISPECIES: sugar O-acetyltransferase [unclassified Demequina]WNM23280.1 sugar O-acetyltransferase [Demequina sp. OYTSA14]WNM26158.1 sugar O-acetyltransferase [Demequina sp. PMTSA13]
MDADEQRARMNEVPVDDPTRTEYQKLMNDEWFKYRLGPELADMQRATLATLRDVSARYFEEPVEATRILCELVEECGPGLDFRPPIYLEYRERVRFGANVFINANLMILGSGEVTIGDNALIGPDARFYTVNHTMDVELRREGWERAFPIVLEPDVWLGGSVVICPGVTIGRGSVVAAGSVVTKDVPPMSVVGGNPARVLKSL